MFNNTTIVPLTTTTAPTGNVTIIPEPGSVSGEGTAVLIGILIGLAVVALAGGCWYWQRARTRRKQALIAATELQDLNEQRRVARGQYNVPPAPRRAADADFEI
jgi:uncharacterized protein HemX